MAGADAVASGRAERRLALAVIAALGCAGQADAPAAQTPAATTSPADAVPAATSPADAAQAPARSAAPPPAATGTRAGREAAAQAAGTMDDETIDVLVRAHAAYVEAGDAQSALKAAELLREYYETRHGRDAFEVLPWVKLHAYSYARVGEYDEARRAFDRAVALTERYEGLYSFSLIDLLSSQARTLLALGETEEAESALLRAKFITHRRLGINNLEQVPVIRELSSLYRQTYGNEKAEREQLFLLRLFEKEHGETPELVPALYEHANYYMTVGDYQSALPVFRRALTILEEAYGENDLRLVEALRGIAITYQKRELFRAEGERALTRAAEIYEQAEYADVLDHAEQLRELGDWHLLDSREKYAFEAYSRAWQLLVEADGNDERARMLLGEPEQLSYLAPLNVYPSIDGRPFLSEENYLEMEVTVNDNGRVPSVEITDSTASRRTENEAIRALRRARYRPAFAEGEPVTARVALRQYFRE